jgi:ubiquinone/menaquinone biosynthesis C-methylase UbiE
VWSDPPAPRATLSAGDALTAGRPALRGAPCHTPAPGVYHRLHARFLRLAGGEAKAEQEAALTMLLRPWLRMLDAGCGPGTVARRLLALEGGLCLTLLDNDLRMLAQCRDLNATQVPGSLMQLPLPD